MGLLPALKIDGKIYTGKADDSHVTIAFSNGLPEPAENTRGFTPDNGKTFLTRTAAIMWLRKNDIKIFRKLPSKAYYSGLHSEHLAKARGIDQNAYAEKITDQAMEIRELKGENDGLEQDVSNGKKMAKSGDEIDECCDLSTKTAIVYDRGGLYLYCAEKLAEKYKKVMYYLADADAYPTSQKHTIGAGVPKVKRIHDFWKFIDEADIVYFWDCYDGELQHWLRSKGYTVFGSGRGEQVEIDKIYFLELLEELGQPCAKTYLAEGMDDLCEYLKKHDGETLFLKNLHRGDFESRKFSSMVQSRPFLDDLKKRLGSASDTLEVLVQHKIDAVCEVGYDGFQVDGQFTNNCIVGYEIKDKGFVGKVFKETPQIIKGTNDAFADTFSKLGYRGNYSTELRVTKDGIPFYIDATCVSDDTEILTDKGWKLFIDLDRSESVATLNLESREIQYQKPIAYQEFDYDGTMISISNPSKSLDLLVTPDHGIYASPRTPSAPLEYFKAGELAGKLSIPRTGKWVGFSSETFVVPEYHKEWVGGRWGNTYRVHHDEAKAVPFRDWLRFMAMYISDGSCGKHVVSIAQSDKLELVEEILSSLPFTY